MNLDLLLVIVFYIVLYLIFIIYRKKFDIENKVFILYRTRIGLKLMDKIAKKCPRLVSTLGFLGVVTGFIGMAFIFYILVKGTYILLRAPESTPVLSPVIPGIKIAGMPVLSFWHWIIAILVIAIVHEFCHGIYARRHNIKIKSSGFAFLGPLLAAFVEPDEKQMARKKRYAQLEILSAGPFSNMLFAFIILLLILFIVTPVSNTILEENGLVVAGIDATMPINSSGIKPGMMIDSVDGTIVKDRKSFSEIIDSRRPGDSIFIKSNNSFYEVIVGKDSKNETEPRLGIYISASSVGLKENIKNSSFDFYPAYSWIVEFLFWLFAISLGVGLFNLLPLGPVDGGRMFHIAMLAVFKNEQRAKKIFVYVTTICLLLILINLLPFIIKLFAWLWGLMF